MNKLILLIVLLAILAGGYMVASKQQNKQASTAMDESTTMAKPTGDGMIKAEERYITYSKIAFDAAKEKKRVYFFHAPWCPTCIPVDKEFQANQANIPEDVVLFKTDYDSSGDLKKQYAVTYQHTFVLVDENGKEIKKWNGGALNELIAHTK